MFTCPFCYYEVDGRTDDNYDSSHNNLCCPNCGRWFSAYDDITAKEITNPLASQGVEKHRNSKNTA